VSDATDLVVVGGGPAGLATAIEARRSGLEVVVVDRRRPPVDAACGEGLMPGGVARLSRLGIDLERLSSRAFHGIRYLDGGRAAEGRFRQGFGLGIRRPTLHAELVRQAELLGADLRWGVAVRGYEGRDVATDRGALSGTWVVAADGRASQMRRWAGIAVSLPDGRRFGVRRHYAVTPWTDLVEVHWNDGAEAYVTPVGPETVGVAVLSATRPLSFDRMLGLFPGLAGRLSGAKVMSRDRGAGPLEQRTTGVLKGRVALVGDASGYLDAISGEGLGLALRQAEALVVAFASGDLGSYPAAHRRITRHPVRLTRLLLLLSDHPRLRRRVLTRLANVPGLMTRFLALKAAPGGPRTMGREGLIRLALAAVFAGDSA